MPKTCHSGVLLVALGLLLFAPSAALSAPSLAGSTGLVKIPTAYVVPEGECLLGFSWVGGPRSYLFRPQTNRMYYASIGLLQGLEVSLDMLQVIGWMDPEAPGVAHAIHRLSNVKYVPPLPEGWPQVALGAQDPLSANALIRGPVGQTTYGLTTYYGVLSQSFGALTCHLGLAHGANFLQGFFGGVDLEVGHGFNLRLEHDSEQWNAGIYWRPLPWWSFQAARLFPDDWAYGTALTWHL